MPYKIKWETRNILTTWTGNATGDELLAFVTELHANPRFDDMRYSLHDFTACTAATFVPETVQLVSALDGAAAKSNSHLKVGIATTRDDVKAMVKAYMGTEISPYAVQIFSTAEEMRDWAEQ